MPLLQQLLDSHPDDVKLILKNYPISERSTQLALAALAANQQEKFWEFHARLEKSKPANDAAIQTIAKELNLDIEKFNADMNGGECRKLLARDRQAGDQVGVKAVPTVFVNGKRVGDPLKSLKITVESELKNKLQKH